MINSYPTGPEGKEALTMVNTPIAKEASPIALYSATGLLVLIAASLLLLPLVAVAFSPDRIQRGEGTTVNGRVVAVEHGSYLTALTLRSNDTGRPPNDQMKIFINQNTMVKICKVNKLAKDIKAGGKAYHKVRGLAFADSVSGRC